MGFCRNRLNFLRSSKAKNFEKLLTGFLPHPVTHLSASLIRTTNYLPAKNCPFLLIPTFQLFVLFPFSKLSTTSAAATSILRRSFSDFSISHFHKYPGSFQNGLDWLTKPSWCGTFCMSIYRFCCTLLISTIIMLHLKSKYSRETWQETLLVALVSVPTFECETPFPNIPFLSTLVW